jgi:hypothetical protein
MLAAAIIPWSAKSGHRFPEKIMLHKNPKPGGRPCARSSAPQWRRCAFSRLPRRRSDQGRLVDSNVEGVIITGSGHWLIDEAPDQVIPRLVAFLAR